MSGPLGFLVSNTHLTIRNPKFRTEIEPECGEDLFFWSSPEFGAKNPDRNGIKFYQTLQKHFAPSEFA